MEDVLPPSILNKVCFVDALWYTMSGHILQQFLSAQFASLDLSKMVLCFWPIVCSGIWSLAQVVHDADLQPALVDESQLELKFVDAPQQPNSVDCGFYVMKYIRCLACQDTHQVDFIGASLGRFINQWVVYCGRIGREAAKELVDKGLVCA